jgi:hypothetical protein
VYRIASLTGDTLLSNSSIVYIAFPLIKKLVDFDKVVQAARSGSFFCCTSARRAFCVALQAMHGEKLVGKISHLRTRHMESHPGL